MVPRYPEFKGQVALVTGSSRGIGHGIALRLGREGMKVVLTGFDAEELAITDDRFARLGIEHVTVPGDLARPEYIDELFQKVEASYGTLDLLVNNAASMGSINPGNMDLEIMQTQFDSNIRGSFLCSYKAVELMRKGHKGGNIISLSSVGGARAHWHSIPYDITKGAIDSLTRALALEVSAEDIRVNAIGPGAIQNRTHAGDDNPEGIPEELPLIPLGRYGIPQDIASMVAFLASPEASYITGQIFYVDGGLLAQLSPREHPI
ncbi:MAG: hypothetical protein BGO39_14300 [Chloroflexi bacterium 54-19]|nr:MAG: hypothetical protein BGO39_14300 [Chloroflexi bacterium 54-19]